MQNAYKEDENLIIVMPSLGLANIFTFFPFFTGLTRLFFRRRSHEIRNIQQ